MGVPSKCAECQKLFVAKSICLCRLGAYSTNSISTWSHNFASSCCHAMENELRVGSTHFPEIVFNQSCSFFAGDLQPRWWELEARHLMWHVRCLMNIETLNMLQVYYSFKMGNLGVDFTFFFPNVGDELEMKSVDRHLLVFGHVALSLSWIANCIFCSKVKMCLFTRWPRSETLVLFYWGLVDSRVKRTIVFTVINGE